VSSDGSVTFASGALGSARNSPGAKEEIGCHQLMKSGRRVLDCWARTPATEVSCFTSDPDLLAIGSTLSGDSLLSFSLATGTLACLSVEVENSSALEPKVP
jgi:hypothetical protein